MDCDNAGQTEKNKTQILFYFPFSKYQTRKKLLKRVPQFPHSKRTNSHPFVHICLVIACQNCYKEPLCQFSKNHYAFSLPERKLLFIRFYFLLDSQSKSTDLIDFFSSNIYFAEQKFIWNPKLKKRVTQASRVGKLLSPPRATFLGIAARPGGVLVSYLTCYHVATDYSPVMTLLFNYYYLHCVLVKPSEHLSHWWNRQLGTQYQHKLQLLPVTGTHWPVGRWQMLPELEGVPFAKQCQSAWFISSRLSKLYNRKGKCVQRGQ